MVWRGRTTERWQEFTGLAEPRAELHLAGTLWIMGESAADVQQDYETMSALGIDVSILNAADAHPLPFGESLFTASRPHLRARSHLKRRRRVPLRGGRRHGVGGAACRWLHAGDPGGGQRRRAVGPRPSQMAGLDVPWDIHPIRAQVIYRASFPDLMPAPIIGDASAGIYMRPENRGQQILIGSIREEDEQEVVSDPDNFNPNIDRAFRDTKIYGSTTASPTSHTPATSPASPVCTPSTPTTSIRFWGRRRWKDSSSPTDSPVTVPRRLLRLVP